MSRNFVLSIAACSLAAFGLGSQSWAVSPYDTSYGIQWNFLNGHANADNPNSVTASPDGTVWIGTMGAGNTGASPNLAWGNPTTDYGGSFASGFAQISPQGKILQADDIASIEGLTGFNQGYGVTVALQADGTAFLGFVPNSNASWSDAIPADVPPENSTQPMTVKIASAAGGTQYDYDGSANAAEPAWVNNSNYDNNFKFSHDLLGSNPYGGSSFDFKVDSAGNYYIARNSQVALPIPCPQAIPSPLVTLAGPAGASYKPVMGFISADGTTFGDLLTSLRLVAALPFADMDINESTSKAYGAGSGRTASGGTMDFIDPDGPGPLPSIPLNPLTPDNNKGFAFVYDTSNPVWTLDQTVVWESTQGGEGIFDITSDLTDDGFVVVGRTRGDMGGFTNPAPGTSEGYIEKYDSSGALAWSYQTESVDDEFFGDATIDPDGNVYVSGNNGADAFVTKFDSAGNRIWTKTIDNGGTLDSQRDHGNVDKNKIFLLSEHNTSGGTWDNTLSYVPQGSDEILLQKLIPGDFTGDGTVNAADIDSATAGFTPAGMPGVDTWDFNEDGDSNLADVVFWVQNSFDTDQGDNDLDGDIDTSDVTTSVINFTGAGGAGKGWADGDTDGDTDVDTSDVTTSVINFTGALAGAPGVPDLWYDPATGNITIDTDGLGDLGALDLQSAGGLFTGDPTDFSGLPVGATDDLDGQIGWVQPFAAGVTGVFDLGNVMQAGLTEAQFLADLAGSQYGIALGAGGGGGQIELFYGPYTAIPEPSSMILLGLAGCMAVVGLRRRAA